MGFFKALTKWVCFWRRQKNDFHWTPEIQERVEEILNELLGKAKVTADYQEQCITDLLETVDKQAKEIARLKKQLKAAKTRRAFKNAAGKKD